MKPRKRQVRAIVTIALFTSIICISSFISVPFGTVPVTLQLFGIYMALFCLGGGRGAVSVCLYVALGAFGLPVFSGFTGGLPRLFDASGGFILGFVILSAIYALAEYLLRGFRRGRLTAAALSLGFFYAFGALWYSVVYIGDIDGIWAAIASLVLPFIPFDILKIYLAILIQKRLKRGIA